MKMLIPCVKCSMEGTLNLDFSEVEISNDGIYEVTCNKGHKAITFAQTQHFEVLFDMGGLALLDGYYREAVTSFAVALERFYEFCIEVISYSFNIELQDFLATWKLVNNKSERQIGAFYFLYLSRFNKSPQTIENERIDGKNIINFRNTVVHNGFFPSKSAAIEYGDKVYNYICLVLKELKESCSDAISMLLIKKQMIYHERIKIDSEITISTLASSTIIGIAQENNRTFTDALKLLEKNYNFIYRK